MKTTVIFTNTRSATERVVHQLKDRYRGSYITIEEVKAKEDLIVSEAPITQQTTELVIPSSSSSCE